MQGWSEGNYLHFPFSQEWKGLIQKKPVKLLSIPLFFQSKPSIQSFFMNRNGNHKVIDDLNWSILEELQKNARLSTTEIGRRIGLSAPAVADRIEKMEEYGIIKGYHTLLD